MGWGFLEDVWDAVTGVAEDAWDVVSDAAEWAWDINADFWEDAYHGVTDIFSFDMPDMPGSPTYDVPDRIGNTISEGVFASRCYGKCKIGGNKIRFNAADDSDLIIIVGHCMGPVNGISEFMINDIEWSELTGAHTYTQYTGTRTQIADARFTTESSAYRGLAYTAFTFEKNDQQVGYNPNITVIMNGLKCPVLTGGADAFTRNPAVILYDWYLNVEGYSAGDLDLNAFKSLEELCDEVPTGGTLPRYRFDFNIDTNMPINDAKKMIWASFNGMSIMSQGKIKPIWDSAQVADGSGSLTAKTVSHAFDLDNIIKDSFSWKQLEQNNLVRINFKDSDKNYKTSSVEIKDEIDINENGEILYEENAWFITDAEIARRRAKYKYNIKRYPDYSCTFSALSGAGDIEIYDLVTITHPLPGWTTKQFIITSRGEDEVGRMKFTANAYYAGCYDDSQVATQENFESALPNPFVAVAVTSVNLEEGGFIAGDGSYVPYVTLSFTKPDNPFWSRGYVYVSTDAGAHYTYYGNTTTGDGFRIDSAKGKYSEGDTVYIKVKSANINGAEQTLASVSAVTIYINGKSARPSDVQGFSAYQIGDIVMFEALRPMMGTDADFSHFDLRIGSTWSASQRVATYTQTRYPLTRFTSGTKTYLVKAVDTSGRRSLNASSVTLTLTQATVQNIFYEAEKIHRMEQGTDSQITRNYVFDYAAGFFVAGTEAMDDSGTDRMNDSTTERMWTPAYDSGYLETEVIDVGSTQTGSIFLDIDSTSYPGAAYGVEYKTSTDDITYTDYAEFSNGVSIRFRYLVFRISLSLDITSYPESNVKISKLFVNIDLPTVKNSGNNIAIAAGGTTITFDTEYSTSSSIIIKTNVISSSALIPTYELVTTTNFKAHVFDPTDGSNVGGTISYTAEGY